MQTSADDRTNTLVVTAPADTMKLVAAIVQRLDSNPTSQETFFIYRLRNGQSQSLAFVLNQLFGNLQPAGQLGIPGAQGRFGAAAAAQQQPQLSGLAALTGGQGLGSQLNGTGGTGIGARRTGTSATGVPGSLAGRVPGLSPLMARAVTELTGQVFVVADPDTNSLLVTTATKYQKQVREIIAELDRPVPQVLIKVLVAEVTHDNSADIGVDFSILNKRDQRQRPERGVNFGNARRRGRTAGWSSA